MNLNTSVTTGDMNVADTFGFISHLSECKTKILSAFYYKSQIVRTLAKCYIMQNKNLYIEISPRIWNNFNQVR